MVEAVAVAVEVEVVEEVEAVTTMMMIHLHPLRDPPDADVDEPTGSLTTPRCNNN